MFTYPLYSDGGGGLPVSFIEFSCPTSTGNIDITADLGGATPKLAIFMLTGHRFSQDPNHSGTVHIGLSACTATSSISSSMSAANNSAASNSARQLNAGAVCHLLDENANLLSRASFVSFISDGVRLNFTVAPALALAGVVWFFYGSAVSAACGRVELDGAVGSRSVTGLGFEPDLILMSNSGDNNAAGNQTTGIFGFGATDGTSEAAVHLGAVDGDATGACNQAIRDDAILSLYSTVTGNALWKVSFTSFDADGFTVNMDTDPSASREVLWIAIEIDGAQIGLIPVDTPTVTGNQAYTGMGFRPDAVMGWVTTQEAVNPASPISRSTTLAGGSGFFIFNSTVEWAASWCHSDDGLTTGNSDLKAAALRLGDGTEGGTGAVAASLNSMDADGFTLNYSVVLGAAKKGWALGLKMP
jgi:hypothetical protein